jgi:hypothetical protein
MVYRGIWIWCGEPQEPSLQGSHDKQHHNNHQTYVNTTPGIITES